MGLKTIGRFVYDSATAQAVDAGGNLPLTTATATCNLTSDGESVTINQGGVFLLLASATLVSTAADTTAEVQLYRNGSAAPGAHAYGTAAEEGDYMPLSFATVVSVPKGGQAVVSLRTTDAASVLVSELIVIKEA